MYESEIESFRAEVMQLNDYIADNPETGSEEFKASKAIVTLLRKHGIDVEFPFNDMDTAFRGTINRGKSKKFAILTEYDALRGLGHACGHCASGSISVFAALILNELRESIDAQIDIIGTPDEETKGGKVYMVNDGVFNDYDAVIMIHMFNMNAVSMPFLALDSYEYIFYGAPAHASASPWEGRNALNALRLAFDAMDMMRQHVTEDVRIHGYISEGGAAANIVPDRTRAEFTFRARERDTLDDVVKWAHDIGEAAAKATRTSVEINRLGEKYDNMTEKVTGSRLLEEIYGKLSLPLVPTDSVPKGSSDIGNVDSVIPAFHPIISIGKNFGVHTREFAEEMKNEGTHNAIEQGAQIITEFIKTLSERDDLLDKIKQEHKQNWKKN